MFRGRFLGALLALLLIIGLLGLAGSSIYRAGWTQGYFVGKVSDGAGTTVVGPTEAIPGEPDAPAARAPYNGPWRAPGFSERGSTFGWFMGGIVKFFLLMLAIGFVFKLFFGMLFWRKRGHWGGKGWGHHGWGHNWSPNWDHDHRPPWHDEPADEPVMKA